MAVPDERAGMRLDHEQADESRMKSLLNGLHYGSGGMREEHQARARVARAPSVARLAHAELELARATAG